jgi:hypothetical protein
MDATISYKLTFDFLSYWHIGSGLEGGGYADALTLKTADGLPFIPGKSIKGLLREAFTVAAENHWFDTADFTSEELAIFLFGAEGQNGLSAQGALQITSAFLAKDEQLYFEANPVDKQYLYKSITSASVNYETGVVNEGSLFSIEVAVPMQLHCLLDINKHHTEFPRFQLLLNGNFEQWLTNCCQLITHIGAKRQRGLGHVNVSCCSFVSQL